MTGPYRCRHGEIIHLTGRVIPFEEARLYIEEWARLVQACAFWGHMGLARVYGRSAISLGEAWIEARDWRSAA